MRSEILRFSCLAIAFSLAVMAFGGPAPFPAAAAQSGAPAGGVPAGESRQGLATVRIGERVYRAELALTPAEQARGLMFRGALAPDRGMLFVFPDEAPRSFWMKNTLIPLDIIFITRNGRIDSFHTMPPCPGDPCPTYRSAGRAVYALEVSAGEVARNRFRVGDRVTISMPPPREAR